MRKLKNEREPIALRTKDLKGGRKSLYLDYYVEGDKNHSHKYEFLKLYLLPDTKANREANAVTIEAAKAIQAKRLIERANNKAGVKLGKSKIKLVDFIKSYSAKKAELGQSNRREISVNSLLLHIMNYNGNVLIADIDKQYCTGLILYLTTSAYNLRCKNEHVLIKKSTARNYYDIFVSILNEAVRQDIIQVNPTTKVDREVTKQLGGRDDTRTYLTKEELKKLKETKCPNENVKNAFFFACYCGLRISDVRDLTWENIKEIDNRKYICKVMKKTRRDIVIPLSENAQHYMPTAQNEGHIFDLPNDYAVSYDVRTWAKAAGIKEKKVCFHVSRHTFATNLLTAGADLYTTSKLLGHTNITTTQIYAEIVDKKKTEAIDKLDNLDF